MKNLQPKAVNHWEYRLIAGLPSSSIILDIVMQKPSYGRFKRNLTRKGDLPRGNVFMLLLLARLINHQVEVFRSVHSIVILL